MESETKDWSGPDPKGLWIQVQSLIHSVYNEKSDSWVVQLWVHNCIVKTWMCYNM